MDATTRVWLLFGICLPLRLILGVVALVVSASEAMDDAAALRGVVSGLAFLVAVGFLSQAYEQHRGRKTHGFAGGVVWWKRARFVHALLWTVYGVLVLARQRVAGAALFADAWLGVTLSAMHYGM